MQSHAQAPSSPAYANTVTDATMRLDEQAVDDLVGRTIDGRYRLDARLGAGGMGAVYVATRLHIGDTVAVKVLRREQLNDPQSSERFRREAQMAARLKHPNAVSVYDFGISSDGLMYIVMEQVEGHSLRQLIKQHGRMRIEEVVEVAVQVCAALDEAHRQQIIHRDIKPDNIIVHESPGGLRVKVLDFGIAKLRDLTASNLTQTGSVMGTPHYMSPEQCMGEDLDSRSDIYSLGIVLYEMLCGVVPFNSPTSTAVVVQQVTQAPARLRSINSEVPPAVEAVVLHALEKRREARPQTAGALAQELRAAVYGAAQQPFVHTPPSVAPATSSSDVVNTQGTVPTVAMSTPISGNRPLSSRAGQRYASGGAASSGKTNRSLLMPLLVGGAILLLGGGAIIGAMWWWLGAPADSNKNQNQPKQVEQQKQAGRDQKKGDQNPESNPAATPGDSADEEFQSLSERRARATPAERPQLIEALKSAETKYPTDYRFPYERARLSIIGTREHDEAFSLLYLAGQKAIENNKADQMMNNLTRDQGSDFRKLTDHREWGVLQQALRNRDKSILTIESRHQ